MTYYIIDSISRDVVAVGFKTKEEAEQYIWAHSFMKQYWYHYAVKSWNNPIAYGLTYVRDSQENGGTTFLIFETWDEAISYAVEHPFSLIDDFDYEDDIYQIDMTKFQG